MSQEHLEVEASIKEDILSHQDARNRMVEQMLDFNKALERFESVAKELPTVDDDLEQKVRSWWKFWL